MDKIPTIFYVYIGVISLVTVIITVYDKIAAKRGGRRIPEATLMLFGAAGGALAELATMTLIRHKTKHGLFMFGLPLLVLGHLALIRLLWL